MGIALAAAIAVLTGAGAAIGIGMATSHASEAIARQPEAKKDIRSTMLIGCALAEATAIYGLLVAIMLIFVADPGRHRGRHRHGRRHRYRFCYQPRV